MVIISERINTIRMAAANQGYWSFLRQQAGTTAAGEAAFWREQKAFWTESAATHDARLMELEGKATRLMEDIDGNRVPDNADSIVDEIDQGTQQLNDEVGELNQRIVNDPIPVVISPNARVLAERLGMEAEAFAVFSEAEMTELIEALDNFPVRLSRDRIQGLRNYITSNLERGRRPSKIISTIKGLEGKTAAEIDDFLGQHGAFPVNVPSWRGNTHMETGNLDEGWVHVDARHVTGNHPNGAGDLFATGTTRAELEIAAQEIVDGGVRVSANPNGRIQTFMKRVRIHGESMNARVTIDTADGRIITIFPFRSGL